MICKKRPFIYAIANQKGGVGKTTTALTLASSLSVLEQNVLLIDIDPQASLTNHLAIEPEMVENSIGSLLVSETSDIERFIIKKYKIKGGGGIDIIPSNINLAKIESNLSASNGGGLQLKEKLKYLPDYYDYVIIDSSPALSVLLISAIAACDGIIIPVVADYLSVRGVELLIKTIQKVEKALNVKRDYKLLITMFDKRTNSSLKSLNYFKNNYKDNCFDNFINVDTKFRDASFIKKPLTYYEVRSRGSIDYLLIAREILSASAQGEE
ncbi:MAG: ParA family protein [bacterium]